MTSAPSASRHLGEPLLRSAKTLERLFRRRSPRVERTLLVVAIILFVAAGLVGYLTLPDVAGPFRWEFLALVALVGSPANILFIALEYMAGARVLGIRPGLVESLRISVVSSAANLLPLPGSVIVRTRGLRQAGSSYRGAFATLVAVGVLWVGTAASVTGGVLMTITGGFGLLLLAGGLALIAAGYVLVALVTSGTRKLALVGLIVAVEMGATAVGVFRIYFTVRALGLPVSIPQATVLQLAGVVATASGIFPSGLGLREALSGAVGPLVGLPASVGLLAATINRLVDKAVLAPGTLVLLLQARRRGRMTSQGRESSPPQDDSGSTVLGPVRPLGS